MAITHPTTKSPGDKLFAVADWNAPHTGTATPAEHGNEAHNPDMVTSVTASSPVASSGGVTPNISVSVSPAGSSLLVGTGRTIYTIDPLYIDGFNARDLSLDRTLSLAGLSSLGTANYIVGVNSGASAWEYKQLIEGSNITITHGVGSITIAASGGGVDKGQYYLNFDVGLDLILEV